MFTVRCDDEFALATRLNAVLLHGLAYTFFTDFNTLGLQDFPHARPAVFAFHFGVHGADVLEQRSIVYMTPSNHM